jgi:cytosine/adenosine deaminase-related metal-dependent hydrolase
MVRRLLIRNLLVLDPVSTPTGSARGHLLLEADRIAAVGSGEPPRAEMEPEEVVDGSGLVAIPGLINTHTHASLSLHRGLCDDADLFAWAEHNYPTIRTLSERDFHLGSELACLDMARAGMTTDVECCRYSPRLFARTDSRDSVLGTLQQGALADIVLLDMDHPLGMTAERALSDLVWATGPDAVRHVLVGGQWVVRDRALTTVDKSARRRAIGVELREATATT